MHELTVKAAVENIRIVTDFVNQKLAELRCPEKARFQIDVAIDELFGNIAQYAYHPGEGPATVRVDVEENPLCVTITFIDQGVPYDPLSTAKPDITLPAEERPIGGLGIFMVHQSMDQVHYEYKDGKNILTIKKNMKQ